MIYLIQNVNDYNNDIRVMLMAFYPGVKIIEKAGTDDQITFSVKAEFEEDKTSFYIYEGKDTDSMAEFYTVVDGDYKDRQVFRNNFKLAMYDLLVKKTGRVLPWGDLTGVRPTKLAMARLKSGATFDETVRHYETTYKTSHRKAVLATSVARAEELLTRDIYMDNDYCLYFGIPFCPSRCLYCSFTSYPIATYKDKADLYIECLKKELSYIAKAYSHKRLVSIYMGGGTPTSLTHEQLDDLLSHVVIQFNLENKPGLEFTVEAGRPDSITREKLLVLKKNKVNRISINPQTMNDETLRTIGRAHTAKQAEEAFALARECGFDNINMDLIAGLPGEDAASMRYTLDRLNELSPESITVHSLAIKRAANLKQQLDSYGESINQDMDIMLDMVSDEAEKLSMEPYYLYRQKNIGGNLENVGYAKEGCACLYNILIMEEMTDIIAAGAGASTKLCFHDENRVERVENCKSVDDYINRFDEMLKRKKKYF